MSFETFIIDNEKTLRMSAFFGVLIIMAVWEIIAPRRELSASKPARWISNIGIVFLNSILVRLIFPAAAVGVALFSSEHAWGIFNYLNWPYWLEFLLTIIVLDFIIYLQHVMVHAIPVLWRFHRMHHADVDFDVTTGSRFHPVEILLSMIIKFAAIIVLGPPVMAVIVFEVILNASAMFNHSNVRLPSAVDKVLRWLIVTPDMHRVHHSVEDDEANSNFGFNLPWWDRLLGTYRDQPRAGHENMTIGIRKFRNDRQVVWLTGMLTLPFKGKIDSYVINRRQWSDDSE